jgi:hypothetical protein
LNNDYPDRLLALPLEELRQIRHRPEQLHRFALKWQEALTFVEASSRADRDGRLLLARIFPRLV